MPASATVELAGHLIDSLLLDKVLDLVVAAGARYELLDGAHGRTAAEASRARVAVTAADDAALAELLVELQVHGAQPVVGAPAPSPAAPAVPEATAAHAAAAGTDAAPPRTTGLGWGHRFLMCPPEHFGVLYEINSWMRTGVVVDPDRARQQWDALVATLRAAGAAIELQPPVEGLPDLVFTANAGIVNGRQFVPARFRHAERQAETPHDVRWFATRGWQVDELPPGVSHEGAGDALPFGPVLVSGYRMRTDVASHAHLSRLTRAAVRSVELVDPRLYHLDITFCPLDDRRAMVAPIGWDRYGARVMEALVPEPLVLDDEAALSFVANSVVVGTTVVMPACPVDVGRRLEAWGFDPVVVDVGEFQKAGGACRCLTLALDVTLGVATGPAGATAGLGSTLPG